MKPPIKIWRFNFGDHSIYYYEEEPSDLDQSFLEGEYLAADQIKDLPEEEIKKLLPGWEKVDVVFNKLKGLSVAQLNQVVEVVNGGWDLDTAIESTHVTKTLLEIKRANLPCQTSDCKYHDTTDPDGFNCHLIERPTTHDCERYSDR